MDRATVARRPRGATRRTAVVDVARRVLLGAGLDDFVLRDIAARADMTLGNLQYYFATRDELLRAVFRAEFDRDLAAFRVAAEGPGGAPDELVGIVRSLSDNWCTGGSSVFATLAVLAQHDDEFARLHRTIYATFYAELEVIVARADATADRSEVEARARLITAVLDGTSLQVTAALRAEDAACVEISERAVVLVVAIATGTVASRCP